MSNSLPFHPIANLFPLIEGREFDEMVEDIRANGLHEDIVMFDGMILDGRNRYRAAVAAGLFPSDVDTATSWHFVVFSAGDGLDGVFSEETVAKGPLAWVLSKNLHRRHLTDGQRVMIAAEIATMKPGRPSEWREGLRPADSDNPANWPDSPPANPVPTQAEAAEMLGVSERQVRRGRQVFDTGAPELIEKAKHGDIAPSAAAEIAKLPITQQLEILRDGIDPRALRQVVKEQRAVGQAAKKVRRDERAAELAQKHREMPDANAGIVYIDPPWDDDDIWDGDTGMDRAPANLYPVMTLLQNQLVEVDKAAAHDAFCLLWVPANRIVEAICCLDAWKFLKLDRDPATGFLAPDKTNARYVTHIAWDKVIIGMGRWVRDRHELLLIARRGKPVAPAPGTQLDSILTERRGEPSAKPEAILDWIDACWPDEVKIEIFRRGEPRPGWLAWGNEVADDAISPAPPPAADEVGVAETSPAPNPQTAVDADVEEQELIELQQQEGTTVVAEEMAHSEPAGPPAVFRSTDETDAIIRAGYSVEPVDLDGIAAALQEKLGLLQAPSKLQVRRRANQLSLGSRDRQRAAITKYVREQPRDGGKFTRGAGS